jgi:hypothetical protein
MQRLKMFHLVFFTHLLLITTLFCSAAHGVQITLAWDPSSNSTVTGYKLYWGTQSGQYALLADVGNTTTETVADLQAGTTYYFAATAYNAKGTESTHSNEAAYTVPTGCTYSISPASKTFAQPGGTGTIGVTTQSGCSWTASSGASWLKITSGSTGTGNGTVSYSVSSNTGAASRTSASTIAGRTFTATQAGTQGYTLSVTKSGAGSGTITNNPAGTTFAAGTTVTLTATPNSGSTFSGWSGACSGTSLTCAITMNSNMSVGASFALKTARYSITASAGTGGSISPTGAVLVNKGASQTFTIRPNSGYKVWYWKIDGSYKFISATSYTFSNVTANHTISAYFTR